MENSQKIESFADFDNVQQDGSILVYDKEPKPLQQESAEFADQKTEEDDPIDTQTSARKFEFGYQQRDTNHSQRYEQLEGDCEASQPAASKRENTTTLYVWGRNEHGQLGLGETQIGGTFPVPQRIEINQQVSKVSCGERHSTFLTSNKQLYIMGNNEFGQLGVQPNGENPVAQYTYPTLVGSLAHVQITDVACGANHTLCIGIEPFLLQNGRGHSVFAWGDNSRGQCGTGSVGSEVPTFIWEPQLVEFDALDARGGDQNGQIKIDRISAGAEHSMFLDSSKSLLFGCGETKHGQIGIGRQRRIADRARQVHAISQQQIIDVACGTNHTLLVTYHGDVYATGSNIGGQLGLGHTDSKDEFQRINGLKNVLCVAAGSQSGAIDCDGQLFVWGEGVHGTFLSPLKISYRQDVSEFDQLSIGRGFGVSRNKKGKVYAWGLNECGQLGSGDTNERSFLNAVSAINYQGQAKSVAAGQDFVIALMGEMSRNEESWSERESQKVSHKGSVAEHQNLLKSKLHSFLTSPAETVRTTTVRQQAVAGYNNQNVTSHTYLHERPRNLHRGTFSSASGGNSSSNLATSLVNPSSAFTNQYNGPIQEHRNRCNPSEFDQLGGTVRALERSAIAEDPRAQQEPRILPHSRRSSPTTAERQENNSRVIEHVIDSCTSRSPTHRSRMAKPAQEAHEPAAREQISGAASKENQREHARSTPSAKFPSQPDSRNNTGQLRNDQESLNRKETFGHMTSPAYDQNPRIEHGAPQSDLSLFTLVTSQQSVPAHIAHETAGSQSRNLQLDSLHGGRQASITVSDGVATEGTQQVYQSQFANNYMAEMAEQRRASGSNSRSVSHENRRRQEVTSAGARSQSPPTHPQPSPMQGLSNTMPQVLHSRQPMDQGWSGQAPTRNTVGDAQRHLPPPKPPKHLPILQPERDQRDRQGDLRRVTQSLAHETIANSLQPSIEQNAHASMRDHRVPAHARRSHSESREEPLDSNYASTISKYNRIHQSSKQLPQDQLQTRPIRVHRRFDSSAAYQSKEVNDYSSSYVRQDGRSKSHDNSKYSSTQGKKTGEQSASTLHVPVSQNREKDKKLRKKYKKLKEQSSRQIVDTQKQNLILKTQIDDLQRTLQEHEKRLRKSDKRRSASINKVKQRTSFEMSSMQEHIQNLEGMLQSKEKDLGNLEGLLQSKEKNMNLLNAQNYEKQERIEHLEQQLQLVMRENEQLKEHNRHVTAEVEQIRKESQDIENLQEKLKLDTGERERLLKEAEAKIKQLSYNLEVVNAKYQEAAQQNLEKVAENTDLKTVVHQLSNDAKTFEGQIESLLKFIDELENNNKDLVRYIDDKNYQAAAIYKSKVTEILAKPRDHAGARQRELEQPQQPSAYPTRLTSQDYTKEEREGQGQSKHCSYSPTRRKCPPQSITPVTLENPSPLNAATDFPNPSLTPPALSKRIANQKQEPARNPLRQRNQQRINLTSVTTTKSHTSHQRFQDYLNREHAKDREARESLDQLLVSMHYKRDPQQSGSYLKTKAGQVIDRLNQFTAHRPTQSHAPDQALADLQASSSSFQDRHGLRSRNPVHERTKSVSPIGRFNEHPPNPALDAQHQGASGDKSARISMRARSQDLHTSSSMENTQQSSALHFQPLRPEEQAMMRASRLNHPKLSEIQTYLGTSPSKRKRLSLERDSSNGEESRNALLKNRQNLYGLDSEPIIQTRQQERGQDEQQNLVPVEEAAGDGLPQVFPKVTQAMMRSELDKINESLDFMRKKRQDLEDCISRYEFGY